MRTCQTCAQTHQGKVRSNNEDAYFVDSALGVYLLSDGMGGARGGEHASRIAIETVSRFLSEDRDRGRAKLLDALEAANRRILEEAVLNPSLEGMGATIVAALDRGEYFSIANVGDSRAYLCDRTGLTVITEDHSWIQEVGVPLGLTDSEIQRHPMRHVLTMALGSGRALSIHDYTVPVKPGAILLLSSDGLHGVISAGDIETILREDAAGGSTLEEKCSSLIQAALHAGGPDNITAVLIRVS